MTLPPRIYSRATRESPDKIRSAKHRAWVRTFACVLHNHPEHECDGPIECAHVKTGNGATNRSKAGDQKTLSFCRRAHDEQTKMGEAQFERKYGISMNDIADEFAAKSPFLRRHSAALKQISPSK